MSPASAIPRINKTSQRSPRDREATRYPATWSATSSVPHFPSPQQCELSLVTWGDTSAESWTNWHPEFLIQLDRIIRKSTPKNTVIFSGHRVWWLLSCSEVSINLKTFQRRVIRNLRKESSLKSTQNIDHALIAQRIGKWSGSTVYVAQGLAGVFADLAAGESILDSFASPFRRQNQRRETNFDKLTVPANRRAAGSTSSCGKGKSSRSRRGSNASSSGWISQSLVSPLGQIRWQPFYDLLCATS
jgi:hypothetical protein